jgi:pSer/pThr/pTyr-binding forkhead associated (FHA) protein
MTKLALRFISGKYKGTEFLLREGKEVVIGRSSELDIVLMEDMVSRRHAVLVQRGDKVHVEDRGSTNGTFVNGEKITAAIVGKGDRILVGTSIMKVVDASEDVQPASGTATSAHRPKYQDLSRTTMHSGARSMSGTIAEVPLPDLIQLFSTSKKTGTLVVARDKVVGKIHLDQGKLIYASLSDAPGLPSMKVITRVLSWDDGTFELLGPEPHNFPETLNLPTEHILMEGLRQLDELRHKQSKLPPVDAHLGVVKPLESRLSELGPAELDVFQLALAAPITVQEALDRAQGDDIDVASILDKLIKKKYLAVEGDLI